MILNFKIEQDKITVGDGIRYYIHTYDLDGSVYLINDLRVIKTKDIYKLFTSKEVDKYFYFKTKEEAEQIIKEYGKRNEFIKEKEFII